LVEQRSPKPPVGGSNPSALEDEKIRNGIIMAFNVTVKEKAMNEQKSEKAEPAVGRKAFDFVGDIKSEFSKISWTSKQELTAYTKIVVGATFMFGMLVYVADLVIQRSLITLDAIFRLISH
jgi:preprotein translocase subunit SecE